MGLIAVIIICICLCTDNMVTANMSAMNMDLKTKSVFSIKTGFYFAGFNLLFFTVGYLFSIIFSATILFMPTIGSLSLFCCCWALNTCWKPLKNLPVLKPMKRRIRRK